MAKKKSFGGTGPFSAGSVVWVPYKGIQWPAMVSRLYASQKKVTYKFLPLDDSAGVFNAPVSKIRPFLLKDQLPQEGDDKLKAAFKAAIEEVTKQRMQKGTPGQNVNDEISEEHTYDSSRRRFCKIDEKLEPKKISQKDFDVGDIILVNWFGYAEWPGIVLAVRKHTVACHFFPLETGRPGWCRKSACQEFNIDQKMFTAMRKREATRERQLALDEAWELMTNTTKEERRESYLQNCKTSKVNSLKNSYFFVSEEKDRIEKFNAVTDPSNRNVEIYETVRHSSKVCSKVDVGEILSDGKEWIFNDRVVRNVKLKNAETVAKRKKMNEEKEEDLISVKEVNISNEEDLLPISHFDFAMEEFLKDYSLEYKLRRMMGNSKIVRSFCESLSRGTSNSQKMSIKNHLRIATNDNEDVDRVVEGTVTELVARISDEYVYNEVNE